MHINYDAGDTEGERNIQRESGVTYKPRVAYLQKRRLKSITRSTTFLLTLAIKPDWWDRREEPLVALTLCPDSVMFSLWPNCIQGSGGHHRPEPWNVFRIELPLLICEWCLQVNQTNAADSCKPNCCYPDNED
uniref:Uncharacterized protein n=1 Tax=Mus musculus TaxID=10090 RepID=Q8BG43_MOUSE|nr:unnamed protein product [Mus musculus]BAC32086.1 unnamed protein product [Mus musculus]